MNVNRLILVCLLLMALAFGGCTQQLNDRGMERGMERGSLSERLHDSGAETLSAGLFDLPSKPRGHWRTLRYIAPMDEVVHGWTLTLWAPLERTDAARVYGQFPSRDDVLTSNQGPGAIIWINDVLFTLDEFGRSFVGTPYAVGYLGLSGKLFEPTTSPARAWKRTDTTNTWSSGFPTDQRTEHKETFTEDTKHE